MSSTCVAVSLMSAMSMVLTSCGGSSGGNSTTPVATTTPIVVQPTVIPANLVTSVRVPTTPDTDKKAAYAFLNVQRSQCGFGLLAANTLLETAAQNHANYIDNNFAAHNDAYSHTEVASYLNFTGVTPTDRIRYVGYSANGGGGEEFDAAPTSATTQQDGVATLLTAGYHLRDLVGTGSYDVGIATAVLAAGTNAVVVEFGATSTPLQDVSSVDVVSYPCEGSSVKTSIYGIGHEVPEPFPTRDYSTQPLGQPIYVRVRVGQTLVVSSVTVVNATTQAPIAQAALFTKDSDQNHVLTANEVLWYPNVPFTPSQSYKVTVVGTNNGTAFNRTFVFTTV